MAKKTNVSVSRRLAKDRLKNAVADLLLVKFKDDKLTADEKANVEASIQAMDGEYLAVIALIMQEGGNDMSPYKKITNEFKAAAGKLNRIKEERERLANQLVTAGKILGSIGQVLKLF